LSRRKLRNSWESYCSFPANNDKCLFTIFLNSDGLVSLYLEVPVELFLSMSLHRLANSSSNFAPDPFSFSLFTYDL
jgi:hypothetical protein